MTISDFTLLKKILRPKRIYNLYYFKPVEGFSLDSRTLKKGNVFVALKGKYKDGYQFIKEAKEKGASLIIAEREFFLDGLKIPYFVVEDSLEAIKKITRYIIKKKRPFVYAITGSVGKTTTKEMLCFLLEEKFKVHKNYHTENNLLGVAKTVFDLKDEKILILELGTNSLGEIRDLSELIFPKVGIITFIKPTHLEGLKTLKNIYEEKTSLLKVNPNIKAVLNKDDPYLRKVDFCKKIYWFGKSKDCHLYARFLKRDFKNSFFLIQDKFLLKLPLQFEGFIFNILAAILGAHLKGIPFKKLVERMNNFCRYPWGRMEMKRIKGFLILNDAYNSNPFSFKESLKIVERFPQQKIAIIGDMLELGEKSIYYHKILASTLIRAGIKYCLLMGKFTFYLKEELKRMGYKKVFHFSSHKKVAQFIKKNAKKDFLIFLKGSRKMELEKIIAFLK